MSEDAKEQKVAKGGGARGGVKGLLTKLPVLIGGVMLVEAALLLGAVKMLGGGPGSAAGAAVEEEGDGLGEDGEAGNPFAFGMDYAEVAVDSFRAPNHLNGRTYLYDVDISVRVKADVREKVEKKLASSTALVRDRMNRIVAQIDPQKLNGAVEPGLETFRRQVKYQLDLIVGEGLIEEVLVPRCIPYRTDY